jgi:stage V sporulation protein S
VKETNQIEETTKRTTHDFPNAVRDLRVSSTSNPKSVAGAIAGSVRLHGDAEIVAIGAGAVNQAIKAVAVARGYMATAGCNLAVIPAFIDIQGVSDDGETKTAIKLTIVDLNSRGVRS